MIETWKKHFETYYDYKIINYTTPQSKLEAGVVLINYDILWRRPEFLKLKNLTVILDESSLIQNRLTKRTKFILKLDIENIILLSGTPVSGKYENLWTQLKLLGYKLPESAYLNEYVNFRTIDAHGMRIKVVDKAKPYKNIDRLKATLKTHNSIFLKTEDCLDLPEKNFIKIKVPNIPEYKKFKKNSVVTIDEKEIVGDALLTQRLGLRQLCSIYNPNKLKSFADLAESTGDRLIVFYNFNSELEQLIAACKKLDRPISQVNGHIKDLSAYEKYTDSITLCQYQSGSMGVNLQKSNKIIYFSPTEKCENWMQSIKRINRIGQSRPCYYYQLICKNSIEESIYRAIERGVDFTNELFKKRGN